MQLLVKNRKAYFEYSIQEKFIAGIVLVGSEVKSIKQNILSITESFCHIKDGEVYVIGMHVGEYEQSGTHNNHKPIRDRKLLLNKKEINKIYDKIKEKGFTLIPLSVILTDRGMIKVEIGLAKGKKLYDKRRTIKERDLKREAI